MIKKGKDVFSRQRKQNVLKQLNGRAIDMLWDEARANHTKVCRACLFRILVSILRVGLM